MRICCSEIYGYKACGFVAPSDYVPNSGLSSHPMPLGIWNLFLVLLIPIASRHEVSGIWLYDVSFIPYCRYGYMSRHASKV